MNLYTINANLSNSSPTEISSQDPSITLNIRASTPDEAIYYAEKLVATENFFSLTDPYISEIVFCEIPNNTYVSVASVTNSQNASQDSYTALSSNTGTNTSGYIRLT